MTKGFWTSKTFWFGLAVAVVPYLTETLTEYQATLGPTGMAAVGALIVVMRFLTNSGVSVDGK